ncbi:MAG: alpha/beta hydrolase [Rhodospirillales bacterium]|nr:alpha/beta hydrolase [Rhodospirillales bacterium]
MGLGSALSAVLCQAGLSAHALSLRGHGESEGRDGLMFARLRDYVADVEDVIGQLPAPPVLIGHSLGGLVVQKTLHRQPIPAAVLMASSPPHGMIPSLFGMAFTNPGLFRELAMVQTFGPMVINGLSVRRALFSDDTPDEVVLRYMHRFQPESTLVILDLIGLDLPPSTPCLDLPVLVLGSEDDMFVFPGGLHATADTYRTKAEIFPGMAHAMMLDHQWQRVADRMLAWLTTHLKDSLAASPRRSRSKPASDTVEPHLASLD